MFTYIEANQNARREATSMGIRNSMQFDSDKDGTRRMWKMTITIEDLSIRE